MAFNPALSLKATEGKGTWWGEGLTLVGGILFGLAESEDDSYGKLPDPVVELGHTLHIHPEEALTGPLLSDLVLQVPHTIPVCELLMSGAHFGQNPALKSSHGE